MTAIRVHSLEHARAALAAARDLGRPLTLVSPPAAALFAGIGWWRELIKLAREEFPDVAVDAVLDCGPAPGVALAAIRAGVGPLWLDVDEAVRTKVSSIAEQAGIRAEGGGSVALDLLGVPDPGGACRAVLGKDHEDAGAP